MKAKEFEQGKTYRLYLKDEFGVKSELVGKYIKYDIEMIGRVLFEINGVELPVDIWCIRSFKEIHSEG
jgi:hypothetical protein